LRPLKIVFVALVALFPLGCTSTEGQCQRVCDWEARCVPGAVNVEDCSQQCVNDAKSRSSDCTDAFDEFASCTVDNSSCPGVDQQCQTEANRLIQKCDCESPTGPLAALCQK
jgi:hypothetical protein